MSLFFVQPPKTDGIVIVNSFKLRSVFLDVKPSLDDITKSNVRNNRISHGYPQQKDLLSEKKSLDIVYRNTKPIINILRVMGVLPFQRPSIGFTEFRFASRSMLYSAVMFIVLLVYVIYVGISRIHIVQNLEGRFEEAVIAYLFIVNLLQIIIVPILWYEIRKITKLFNDWTEFEVKFIFY